MASTPQAESVAIVVVLYNCRDLLPSLVASLDPGCSGVPYELIAVDNCSPDDSAAVMQDVAPEVRLVRMDRNAGYAAGINAGVAAAGPHTAVLAINPDVRLGAGCVPELLTALRTPGVGIAVPLLSDADGELIESLHREPTLLRALGDLLLGTRRAGRFPALGEVITAPSQYRAPRRVDWAEGSTQLISAACWQVCGPWDESFFLYSEETEYDLRARDRGHATLFVPTAHAVHLEGGSGSSPALWSLLVTNEVKLFGRRHGRVATAVFWLLVLLRESKRSLLGRPTSRAAVQTLLRPARQRALPGAAPSSPGFEGPVDRSTET